MKLIDKDAVVAEIERQILTIDNTPKITDTQISVLSGNKVILTKLLSFINTLEVKEVDLGKELETEIHNKIMMLHKDPYYEELADFARHFVGWGKKQAEIEIQTQSMAFANGCPKESVSGIPIEAEFPYTNPADTLDGEIDNIWNKLSNNKEFVATKSGFSEVIHHFANWQKQQMMGGAVEGAFIRRNKYTKLNILNGFDTTCDAIQKFKDKDRLKIIFIKEEG